MRPKPQASVLIRVGQSRVLVYAVDNPEVTSWADAVTECETERVDSLASLEAALVRSKVRVVVCGWAPGLWDRIQMVSRGTRIIFCGSTVPKDALEDLAAGHRVMHAASPDELHDKVLFALRTPRRAVRHKVQGLRVSLAGTSRRFDVIDLSNQGVAFLLTPDEPLDGYLPGAQLHGLQLQGGDRTVIDGVTAEVRNVEPITGGYRVGCSLAIRRSHHAAESLRIDERAQCAGLLQAALAERGLTLRGVDDADVELRSSDGGELRLDEGVIVLQEQAHGLQPSDIVAGSFEREGCLYRFNTVVLGTAPLTLRAPSSLEQVFRRSSERHAFTAQDGPTVEIESPTLKERITRPVLDLSGNGLSFAAAARAELLPLGLVLDPLILRLAGHAIRCKGQVRTHAAIPGDDEHLRCGVAISGLDEAARVRIADTITKRRFPNLSDGGHLDLATVFSFFEKTGFVNDGKRKLLEPLLPRIAETLKKVGARETRLFKSFVVEDPEGPVGYVSGVRTYSSTFQLQHLAAFRGRSAAGGLVRAIIEHVLYQTDYAYAMFWFVRENPFPSRVFGGFGRKALDPNLCDMREYAHITLTAGHAIATPHAAIEVGPPAGSDLELVERHLVSQLGGLLVRAHDLTRATLSLSAVNESYWEVGLSRRRHVFVARLAGTIVGFALAELSSPGLNLSEGLSSFRLFVLPGGNIVGDDVRRALLIAVRDFYTDASRPFALGLVDPADTPSFDRVGLPCEAVSLGCTAARSQLRLFAEHTARVTMGKR